MTRIHTVEDPELKTLFCIRTYEPGKALWGMSDGLQKSEYTLVDLFIYAGDLEEDLLEKPYILRIIYPQHDGMINVADDDDKLEIAMNDFAPGYRCIVELSPFYNRKDVLRDVFNTLKAAQDTFLESTQRTIDFDEKLCWVGGQLNTLKPVLAGGGAR
jgi:hypothetical protein